MKKILFLLSGILLQFLGVQAQTDTQASVKTNSLLWRVSGNKLQKPSYLFGTIHLICDQDYFFTPAMAQALQQSDQLILEMDLSDPAYAHRYEEQILLPDGQQLRDFFSNEDRYQQFAQSFKDKVGMDLSLFGQLKPLAVLSLIAMKSYTCPQTASYELKLMGQAKDRHIPILGLETMDAQMAIFDAMSRQDLEAMLWSAFENPEGNNEQDEMVQRYRAQDLQGLYDLITRSAEIKGHQQELLDQRNRNWVKQLPGRFSQKPSFVAVGAGHLAGPQGLISLLRQAGYTVEAVQ